MTQSTTLTLSDAQSALEHYFGFSRFREGQAEVIEAVLQRKDVIVVMPTGGGKSLCYQLPALLFPGATLVISPLIALMKDQVDALEARGISATFINSSINQEEQHARLRRIARGEISLVYVAPERFRNPRFVEALKAATAISVFAVDEAHCISQWGHDFRPDYLRLRDAVNALERDGSRPQIIALTATATPTVRTDIERQLGLNAPASFVAGFDRHNLFLRVEPVKTDRDRLTKAYQIIKKANGTGIIYCSTRKNVDEVSSNLRQLGLKVGQYHAGMDDAKRARMQDLFMASDLDAIVATNAFGMGVDKADLRFVTHYNLPGSIEAYYQEVGRAGRDGLPSLCTLLFNYVDTRTHEFFIEGTYPPRGTIEMIYSRLTSFDQELVTISSTQLAQQLGIRNEMSVNSALVYLEKAGHIERVQGIRVLDRVAPRDLRLDWNDLARREAADRKKLREIVDFAYYEKCLREFILRYFGDRKPVSNCRCSNCQPRLRWGKASAEDAELPSPAKSAESASVPEPSSAGPRPLSDAEHLAVRKILSCVARMEGRFGKSSVAAVLRGSKAKHIMIHQLDQLSTYGLLSEYSQDDLTKYLNALIVAGAVKQAGGAFPTVALTTLGRAVMLDQARIELDLEAVEADTTDEPIAVPSRLNLSQEQSYALYREGKSIEEIARERNLKPSTISEHLLSLLQAGRDLNIDRLIDPAEQALIEAAARQVGTERLTPIKEALPERISYDQIRLVLARMKARSS